jgi:hypothetical protein
MKYLTVICLGLGLGAVVSLSGCASGPIYGGQYYLNDFTQTKYQSDNYTVLGPVTAHGRAVMVLGVYVSGHEGEGLLWAEARNKYGDKVTGIKDMAAIGDWTSILWFVYAERLTTYSGIAIRDSKVQ